MEALSEQLRRLIDANTPDRTGAERAQACESLLSLGDDLKPTYITGAYGRRQPLGIRTAKPDLKALHKALKRAADSADALVPQALILLLEHSDRPIGIWRATLRAMIADTKAAMDADQFQHSEQSLRVALAMETARILTDALGIAISRDRIRDGAPLTQAPFARILTVVLEVAGLPPDLNRTMKAALALLADPFGDRAD